MKPYIIENKELMKEWDWEKNNAEGLNPEKITEGSGKKAWWICEKCGYGWMATINHRTNRRGCPYCSGKKVCGGYNDFETWCKQNNRINLLNEWNCEKNNDLGVKPNNITAYSNKKVWWKCDRGHEWQTTIAHRTNNRGCPYCARRILLHGINDLQTKFPKIAAQWHPTKNGNIKPNMIFAHSRKKFWWQCKYGHEWQAKIANRSNGSNCPFCHNKTSFPEQAICFYIKQVFPDAINRYRDLGFELDIYIPSIKTAVEYDGIWFHKDKKSIEKNKNQKCKNNNIGLIRIREPGLPVYNDCVCLIRDDNHSNNSLINVIEKLFVILGVEKYDINIDRDQAQILEMYRYSVTSNSLAILNPEIAAEWHPTKNGNLKPNMFSVGSEKKVWWQCRQGHEWQAIIYNRTKDKGTECPYCANRVVMLETNDLQTMYPNIAAQWHPTKNGDLKPDDLFSKSGKKVWWLCPDCGYEWRAQINNRSNGSGCPCCANRVVVAGINDLQTKFPDIAAQWHPTKNENIKPNMIVYGSHKKVWWLCNDCGYEWQTSIYNRTHSKVARCLKCKQSPYDIIDNTREKT